MKIGEIATTAGIPPKTIRFWEPQNLIPEPARTASGYRDFGPDVIERLAFIRHAQVAGLTLEQIRQILGVGDSRQRPCAHVTELIAQRLEDINARITELKGARNHLRSLADRAAAQDPAERRGYCSIITG